MKICAHCNKEIEADKYFSRRSTCPHCGWDMYVCLNCRFYSETSHNKCLEPKAEFQRVRDKMNHCECFVFREGLTAAPSDHKKEDARKRFEDLFWSK